MAEFFHFITKQEYINLIKSFVNRGFIVQPDLDFPKQDIVLYRTLDDIEKAINQKQYKFFLLYNGFTRYDLEPHSFLRNEQRFWCYWPDKGGPVLEFDYGDPYVKSDGSRYIPCSGISHQSRIVNPQTKQYEPVGDAIREVFKQITSDIRKKKRKVQTKVHKRTAYVWPGVEELIREGWKLAPPFDEAT